MKVGVVAQKHVLDLRPRGGELELELREADVEVLAPAGDLDVVGDPDPEGGQDRVVADVGLDVEDGLPGRPHGGADVELPGPGDQGAPRGDRVAVCRRRVAAHAGGVV